MKIAIANYTGNVGKSAIANAIKHILGGMSPTPVEHWAIESINSAEGASRVYDSGSDLSRAIIDMTEASDRHIVGDFGASEIKAIMDAAEESRRMLKLFDAFIIPMGMQDRDGDADQFIAKLIGFGYPANRVYVLINKGSKPAKRSADISADGQALVNEYGVNLVSPAIPEMSFFKHKAALTYSGDPWSCLGSTEDQIEEMTRRGRDGDLAASKRLSLIDGAESLVERFTATLQPMLAQVISQAK